MLERKIPLGLWIAVAFTALVSLYALAHRHRVEARNRAVTMAAEFETVESLAASQGIPIDQALVNLRAQGLRAIALSEESVGQLISEGRATLQASTETEQGQPIRTVTLDFSDSVEMPRVARGLQMHFGSFPVSEANTLSLRGVPARLVRTASIGLDPVQVEAANRAGLLIVARYANPAGVTERAVKETLAWGKEQGAVAFLPLGDQVLGRKDALKTTSETLKALGIRYASPEFTRIGGDANMLDAQPENAIRLHSAQVAELDKMSLADAVERYAKAARERNMRILLLRPASYGADQPLSAFAQFAKAIGEQIRKEGGDLGPPRPFEDPQVPRFVFVLIGLGVAAVAWFVAATFVTDRNGLLAGGALLILIGLSAWNSPKYAALVAALAFPVAAFVVLDRWRPKNPLAAILAVSAISLVGGLAVAGLMSTLKHIVKADEFAGVKLAVFLPILIVGWFFFTRLTDWRANARAAITWGASGLFIGVLAILGLLIARTGNDSGVGASAVELQFRNLLDAALYVRPRTKEFLFGHPMLMLGAFMLARYGRQKGGWAGWTALVLMLGAVGQTDIVNTLCHGHIPVQLSIARVLVGLVVGCILGSVAWWIAARVLPPPREEAPLVD
ncbi:MAG TPA: DUF5693 family protein [Fimbriimonas sp.]